MVRTSARRTQTLSSADEDLRDAATVRRDGRGARRADDAGAVVLVEHQADAKVVVDVVLVVLQGLPVLEGLERLVDLGVGIERRGRVGQSSASEVRGSGSAGMRSGRAESRGGENDQNAHGAKECGEAHRAGGRTRQNRDGA